MKEEKIALLADSGCDIPADLAAQYNIHVLPLRIMYPEKDYKDGVDIQPLTVYERFPEDIPTTSTPTMEEIGNELTIIKEEGYTHVIAICISSGLSGTCNTVRLALEDCTDLTGFVFDTKNISFGSGVFAVWAAKKIEEGQSFSWITEKLAEKVYDSRVFYYMDTLKYLQKGGRIGLVTSTLGTVLHIKPIISCNKEGVYYTVAKLRGAKNARNRLVEEACRAVGDSPAWFVFGHGNAEAEMDHAEAMVKETRSQITTLYKKQINASLAVHTGPGLVGILVFLNP